MSRPKLESSKSVVVAAGCLTVLVGCQIIAGIQDRTFTGGQADSGDLGDAATGAGDDSASPDTSTANPDDGKGTPNCQGDAPGSVFGCGPTSNENCCRAATVPAGTYARSYDAVSPNTDTQFTATVGAFGLDVYEITIGRFRAFVNSGHGTQALPPARGAGVHPSIASSGWDSQWNTRLVADTVQLRARLKCSSSYELWTDLGGLFESYPMHCLTWYEAFAFCAWDGGRLPTEAEWNYAAAGGGEQRAYPWSNPATSTTLDATLAVFGCLDDGRPGCAITDIARAGSKLPKGGSRWGHADLSGNLWEWTLDVAGSYPLPCSNCASLRGTSTAPAMIRGGSFADTTPTILRGAYRGASEDPLARRPDLGARCARPQPTGDAGASDATAD